MLKISLLFAYFIREFFELRMRNFQGIIFIWTQTYRDILKSVLEHI